jgi:hypothetical protein
MAHPLVEQLRFTRSELLRGLEGVSEEEGSKHCSQMNCISWMVGHLAWHEQINWIWCTQRKMPYPKLHQLCATNAPMSTPSLSEMIDLWHQVTTEADPYLDTLTTEKLQEKFLYDDGFHYNIGTGLHRITYHYWYHIGEIQSVRQFLGHSNLPDFVGDIDKQAPYCRE